MIYGLSGILSLMITDRKALEETMMAQAGTQMMNQQNMMGGGKDLRRGSADFLYFVQNYNNVFKAEKENYEILNWKFALDDVEDAFIAKYNKQIK